jgi:hypothetical protein
MSLVLKNNLGETHNGNLFQENMLTKKVIINITKLRQNIKILLEQYLNKNYTGKCFEEGYIEKNSVKVVSFTNGLCVSEALEFHVVFTCNICLVVDSMILECVVENKNLSGIKCKIAISEDEENESNKKSESLVIFCTRDHNNDNEEFNTIELNDKILVKVIGSKYELFDEYICVIGKFIKKT